MAEKKVKIRSREAIPCNFSTLNERLNSFSEVNLGYTNIEEVIQECERCYQCFRKSDPEVKPPPCMKHCPTHCNSRDVIRNVLDGNIDEALKIIYEHYPFPRSVERVCPGYCQQYCTAGKRGDPIQIPTIKRYIVDNYKVPKAYFKCDNNTGKKIAIVGSGPLGLTVTYFLQKYGFKTTIFEKMDVLGGMMATEIPEFRLPRKILNEEIENIKKLGAKFVVKKVVDDQFNVQNLLKSNFDAVVIGIGAHRGKWTELPGEEPQIILQAIDFLKNFHLKKENPNLKAKKVIVIGGGSTATDAARVSKRLGAEVSILYRRDKEQMPAGKAEIRDTKEEGIIIKYLTNPVEFVCNENEFQIVVCQKVKLGDVDDSGRPKPILIDNTEFKIEADYLIEAIGQEPNLEGFDKQIFKITRANTFEVDDKFFTSVSKVLAGGDCVTGSKSVVNAVAQGKIIANQIKILLT